MGIILEVGIHCYHNVSPGGLKTGIEGRCLSCVLFKADYAYLRIL